MLALALFTRSPSTCSLDPQTDLRKGFLLTGSRAISQFLKNHAWKLDEAADA